MWNDGNGDWVWGRMKRRSYSWLASLRWVKMVDLQDLWDIHTQDYSPSPANRVPLVGSTTPPIIIQMHCIALMSRATHPPTTQTNVHCNMLIKENNDKKSHTNNENWNMLVCRKKSPKSHIKGNSSISIEWNFLLSRFIGIQSLHLLKVIVCVCRRCRSCNGL